MLTQFLEVGQSGTAPFLQKAMQKVTVHIGPQEGTLSCLSIILAFKEVRKRLVKR